MHSTGLGISAEGGGGPGFLPPGGVDPELPRGHYPERGRSLAQGPRLWGDGAPPVGIQARGRAGGGGPGGPPAAGG